MRQYIDFLFWGLNSLLKDHLVGNLPNPFNFDLHRIAIPKPCSGLHESRHTTGKVSSLRRKLLSHTAFNHT
jgi:hypothetical protein